MNDKYLNKNSKFLFVLNVSFEIINTFKLFYEFDE